MQAYQSRKLEMNSSLYLSSSTVYFRTHIVFCRCRCLLSNFSRCRQHLLCRCWRNFVSCTLMSHYRCISIQHIESYARREGFLRARHQQKCENVKDIYLCVRVFCVSKTPTVASICLHHDYFYSECCFSHFLLSVHIERQPKTIRLLFSLYSVHLSLVYTHSLEPPTLLCMQLGSGNVK